MLRKALAGLIGCLVLFAAVALAETKTVILKDGSKFTGDVVETETGYQVRTRFGVRNIPRSEVESITVTLTPAEEFETRHAELADDDADGHLALGIWAHDNELLEQAKQQCEYVLTLRPDDDRAKLLLLQIEDQLDDEQDPEVDGPTDGSADGNDPLPDDGNGGNGGAGTAPESLVSMEEIYRMRLAELRFDEIDTRLRIRFTNDVIDRFAGMWEGIDDFDKRAFLRSRPFEQLEYILDQIGDNGQFDSIRDDILILSEPQFMQDYQEVVWRQFRRDNTSCAASSCHASAETHGGLRLVSPLTSATVDERSMRLKYTNFVILDSYETPEGLRIIDRDHPEDSLFLQYGLPAEMARYKHPEVAGLALTPLFANRDDPRYVSALEWIRNTLRGPMHPDYRLTYRPPSGQPASQDEEVDPPEAPEEPETSTDDVDDLDELISSEVGPGPADDESGAP